VDKLCEQHEEIAISTEFITLGQFIKLINIFESGGMVKNYLKNHGVLVNGKLEKRRGRKLYLNDVVKIDNDDTYIVVEKS